MQPTVLLHDGADGCQRQACACSVAAILRVPDRPGGTGWCAGVRGNAERAGMPRRRSGLCAHHGGGERAAPAAGKVRVQCTPWRPSRPLAPCRWFTTMLGRKASVKEVTATLHRLQAPRRARSCSVGASGLTRLCSRRRSCVRASSVRASRRAGSWAGRFTRPKHGRYAARTRARLHTRTSGFQRLRGAGRSASARRGQWRVPSCPCTSQHR